MTRRFEGDRLVIASHNPGKVQEIAALLQPYGVEVVSAGALGLAEPEETGSSFAENAALKARAAAASAKLPALADDSGLVVPALGGDPGIYSARWAGPEKDFGVAMEKVEKALGESEDPGKDGRRAHFTCALAIAWPDGHVETFEGAVHGTLVWPPRGERGFGYDPIFQPDGRKKTFGEMKPEKKHTISHRARAFKLFVDACFGKE
ncbi:MAG: RdgB/HAM1 family non-canonical purine NTP pyrophosphatase [Gammaproteobacteria bacterium]|jgi:XTP/dITP diphosphohydrolase